MNAWKAILAALVLFAAGLVTGLTAAKAYQAHTHQRILAAQPNGAPGPRMVQHLELMRRMVRELQLTADQQARIDQALSQSRERMKQIWEQVAPQAHEEMRLAREHIAQELTPDQRTRFENLLRHNPRRPDRPDRANGPDRPDRPDHPARPERPERAERSGPPADPGRP